MSILEVQQYIEANWLKTILVVINIIVVVKVIYNYIMLDSDVRKALNRVILKIVGIAVILFITFAGFRHMVQLGGGMTSTLADGLKRIEESNNG